MVAAPPRPALSEVTVAPLHRRHLRGVLAIEQLVYPRPWSPGLFATEIADRNSRRYLVALAPPTARTPGARLYPPRARRLVVGYAGLMVAAGEAHVTTIAVHPAHHRRKVATRLLLGLLEEARALGATAATLEVRVANRGAQRLYQGFGFAPVGVRPGYYAETGEDALIMWVHALQSDEVAARLVAQRQRLSAPGGASGAPDLHIPWVQGRVGLPASDDTPEEPDPVEGSGLA